MDHPKEVILEAFLSGDLSPEETREVAGHLLKNCDSCQQKLKLLWPAACDGAIPSELKASESISWERVARRAARQQSAFENERAEAPSQLAQLMGVPMGQRLIMLNNSVGLQTWGLCQLLLSEAAEARFDDVDRLLDLADTAVALSSLLDGSNYGHTAVRDMEARAWSQRGVGMAILHEFGEAANSFSRADQALAAGTGDPLELANSLKQRFSLLARQRRLDEAVSLCERTASLYLRLKDRHGAGEVYGLLAYVRDEQGRCEEALELLRKSIEALDPEIDLRSVLANRHNLVHVLHRLGRSDEALQTLRETRPLYEQTGDQLALLRLRYLEGSIAADMGLGLIAERSYLEARNGFVANGMAVDAAEATLELAILYLRDGRFSETCRLATQMVPIFRSRGLHQEAMAGLLIFREAAIRETATVGMVQETLKLVRATQKRSS